MTLNLDLDLGLDFDLSLIRVFVDTLGHTPMSLLSVNLSRASISLLPRWVPFFVGLSRLCLSSVSWLTWSCLKSWNLPVQCLRWYALVVHLYHMTKPVQSPFSQYVLNPVLFNSRPYFFISSKRHLICFCRTWWAAPSCVISFDVNDHSSALCTRVDKIIHLYARNFTFKLVVRVLLRFSKKTQIFTVHFNIFFTASVV